MSSNESFGPSYTDTPTTPLGMSPSTMLPKPRVKLYITLGVIVAIILILLSVWLWYSRPSKVLGDALNKTFTAQSMTSYGKLSVHFTKNKKPASTSTTFTTQSSQKGEQINTNTTLQLNGSTTSSSTNIATIGATSYFRIHNAPALVAQLDKTTTDKNVATVYNVFATSVNDKWIKVDTPAVPIASAKTENCASAVQSFSLSRADQTALKKLFSEHQFLEQNTSVGAHQHDKMNGTHYYSFLLSKYPAIQFYKGASKLNSFKNIFKQCNLPVNSLESDTTVLPQTAIELWVTQWSHQPTRIALQIKGTKNSLDLDTHLSLNTPVQLSVPKDATSLTTTLKGATAKAIEAVLEQSMVTPH